MADSPLPEVDDPHSACLYRGRLVVASTGTDEVLSYELAGHRPRHPQVVWSPTGAEWIDLSSFGDEVYDILTV